MTARAVDVICVGEALWDLATPRGGSFASSRKLTLEPGGGAVNVALALGRLGRSAALCAVVGRDALGDALGERLDGAGVDTSFVTRAPARTGLVLVEPASGRVVSYRSADEEPPRLPRTWRARAVLLSGLLPSKAQANAYATMVRAARRRGALVVVDANARPRMWRDAPGLASMHRWLATADVVKASEQDLACLGWTPRSLRAHLGPRPVLVVTAGPAPARATGPFGSIEVAARRLSRPKPAMGAGDGFAAGLLDTVLDARPWRAALEAGHRAAVAVMLKRTK